MLIKAGVEICWLRSEIRKKLTEIEGIYNDEGNELIITSTFEGHHSAGSLHYADLAIDFRLPNKNRERVVRKIRKYLRPDYDVIMEVDHLHVEYDPK